MTTATPRDRVIGNSILTVLFALFLVFTAVRAWRAVDASGMSAGAVIWLMAFVGAASLTWRSIQAVRQARAEPAQPPGPPQH